MNLDAAQETFFTECRELLEDMEGALLQMEHQAESAELINSVFRAAHTIKGNSGIFGYGNIESFTHVVESVLDRVREGSLAVGEDLVAVLLSCKDCMQSLLESAASGDSSDTAKPAEELALRQALEGFLDSSGPNVEAATATLPNGRCTEPSWRVSVRFSAEVLRLGMDPLSILRYLGTLGEVRSLRTLWEGIPDLDAIDPESCYLGLEFDFLCDCDPTRIEEAFAFVRNECVLEISPSESLADEEPVPSFTRPDTPSLAGLEAKDRVEPDASAVNAGPKQRTLRVDAEKLDQLVNLVGELVIAGAGTSLIAQRSGNGEMIESISLMSRLVEEIRDKALRLRMVQIGETFNRFQRVVRDVSKDLGKAIRLQISGGETELDKTVVEKIGDPLMHLVRNAIDHGIEAADVRLSRSKPEYGQLRLNAFHDSGSIVIEVSDDGGGLDKQRILNKAMERGILQPGDDLPDHEIYRLIFEPGFSTAATVTNLSGRGVGMDVVKRNIEALRGTINVSSQPGWGTTVSIRLPLTLAIIDGFLVSVSGVSHVIPLDMVHECIELSEVEYQTTDRQNYINLRGEVLPLLRLRDHFSLNSQRSERENIVVVRSAGLKAGLVVDELLGEFQTVIKPLGKLFRNTRGVSGSTILGTGEVAVILDVPNLLQQVSDDAGYTRKRGESVTTATLH